MSDAELVKLIVRTGEDHYMKELYQRYTDKVYGKCVLMTKDRELSKDLTHDIFIKIFLNISKFRGDSDLSFWIHSITYNHCLAHIRKKKNALPIDTEMEEKIPDEHDGERERKKILNARIEVLEQVFDDLKEEDRLVLLMRYKDGFSVKNMAQALEIGESAMKMRLKRARHRLYNLLVTKEA